LAPFAVLGAAIRTQTANYKQPVTMNYGSPVIITGTLVAPCPVRTLMK
jgi:hypothetical protein